LSVQGSINRCHTGVTEIKESAGEKGPKKKKGASQEHGKYKNLDKSYER